MGDMKMEGFGRITGGTYDNVKIGGLCSLKDNLSAKKVVIEGVFNSNGKIEAEEIFCEGVANMKESLRAEKINISGVINVSNGKIEAKDLYCEGVLKTKDEISADQIVVDGCIQANEIFGDEVRICKVPGTRQMVKKIFGSESSMDLSKVELIEATNIKLNGIQVKNVNGENVTIGEFCDIGVIDCTGTLIIHPEAKVGKITGVSPEYRSDI